MIAIGLGLVALAAIPLLSSWVPPYGGGAAQLVKIRSTGGMGLEPEVPSDKLEPEILRWVYGRLLDDRGRPVPNAKLGVRHEGADRDLPAAHATDDHGNYRIPLTPGRWSIDFAGGPYRRDSGKTPLVEFDVDHRAHQRVDLKLPGTAALLAEVQVLGLSGLYIECELLGARGEVTAEGRAIGAEPCLAQCHQNLYEAIGSQVYKPEAVLGQALCFEGLSAGEYRLRVHLNREHGLFHERRLHLETGSIVDLGRLNLGVEDFGADHELTARYLDRSKHIDPRFIYCAF